MTASAIAAVTAVFGLLCALTGLAIDSLRDGTDGVAGDDVEIGPDDDTEPPEPDRPKQPDVSQDDSDESDGDESPTGTTPIIGDLTVDIGGIDLVVPGASRSPETNGISRPLLELIVERATDPEFLRIATDFFSDASDAGGSFLSDNFEVLVDAAGQYIVQPVIEAWLDDGGDAPSIGPADAQIVFVEISNELEQAELSPTQQALVALALLRALGDQTDTVDTAFTSGDNNVTVIVVNDAGVPQDTVAPGSTTTTTTMMPGGD